MDLFNVILDRTLIRHSDNLLYIDKISLFTAFRIILFCDEIHDFSEVNKEINYDSNLVNNVIEERLKILHTDIIWFLQNFNLTNINQNIQILKSLIKEEVCFSLNKQQEYIEFILNSRKYFTLLILEFYKSEMTVTNSNKIKNFLINISSKILDYSMNIINDDNCKKLVENLCENIFGIKQIPYNYCKSLEHIDILSATNEKNNKKLSKIALFIDQIGASKNYCSVNAVIAKIIQDIRESGKINEEIFIVNTLASNFDSSSTTSIDKMIKVISGKEEYKGIFSIDHTTNDSNNDLRSVSFKNNLVELKFAGIDIIIFRFNNLNLTIQK